MDDLGPLERAKLIAAKLSGGIVATDLGKRKWDDPTATSGLGLGMTKKKKVYIPVNDHPGVNFLGLLIGPRGITQKQLQESSGAKIVIRGRGAHKDGTMSASVSHPDDDDELHVSIEGTDEAIEKAYKDVQEILYNPEQAMKLKENQLQSLAEMNGHVATISTSNVGSTTFDEYQIELRVPNHMVGLVIGKGGENIQKMQIQTGAHMQIAKESDMKPGETLRSIWLKGSPVAVAELKIRVEDIINARMNPSAQNAVIKKQDPNTRELEHAFVIKVPVPNDKVGIIIGKGGMTVKAIQERTRATVQIPTGPDEDNNQIRTLSIGADTKESADAAQMEIFMALQTQQQQQSQLSNQVSSLANAIQIVVPDDKVGLIIGKGGMTIKDIQARTRVKVQIPQSADPGTNPPIRTLTIIGPTEQQHLARYEIEMVVTGQINTSQLGQLGQQAHTQQVSSYLSSAQSQLQSQNYYLGGMNVQSYQSQPVTVAYGMNPYQQTPSVATAYPGYSGYEMQQQSTAYYGYNNQGSIQYNANTQQIPGSSTNQQSSAAVTSAVTDAAPTDPTAYYNDFWLYASYYGEAAARVYYGAWSPPEGTPNPNASDLTTTATTTTAATLVPSETSPVTIPAAAESNANDVISSNSNADAETSTTNSSSNVIDTDPEAQRQWEEYKKQYAQWYEEHGKAAGADPNPPRPQ